MVDPTDLQARLKALNEAYAAQLPEKIKQIEQLWSQLPRGEWDEENFQNLHRMVHSLTGSGKTFGFASLSDVARNLEEYLWQFAQAKRMPDEEQCKRIRIFLSELHQLAIRNDASVAGSAG
jgi:chemotaxis protein histidine kinase CheA